MAVGFSVSCSLCAGTMFFAFKFDNILYGSIRGNVKTRDVKREQQLNAHYCNDSNYRSVTRVALDDKKPVRRVARGMEFCANNHFAEWQWFNTHLSLHGSHKREKCFWPSGIS